MSATSTQQGHGSSPSLFKQPGAVWAVAFACVISFMGIGLVDPILPALASQLHATPAQVSLLFTSYLVVTAIAMIGVGWLSSRIGSKNTLILGLSLIVVFAGLAGTSDTIAGIVGFRAGWGLGNAMFIATSLAVIVASASGGFSGAIILYEAALGIGIAAGPLLGGFLGDISWRGPFYGVAVLMAIALVATLLFVQKTPKPVEKSSLVAPIKALRHRGLLTMGIMALLYNWGFFTMLGYAPYPMHLEAMQLGLVFTGWGILVAIFAVFLAPRLQRRFGTAPTLYANLVGLGIVMSVIALGIHNPTVIIIAVIVSGAFIGINNTLTTQAVMLVAPVDRPIASSAYGFVRFIGGGLAPFVAGKIAEATDQSVAFYVGAAAFIIAIPVLASGHRLVTAAEKGQQEPDEPGASVELVVGSAETESAGPDRPVIVAVNAGPAADQVVDAAAELAAREHAPLDVVHVRETEIVEELAVSPETPDEAMDAVRSQLARVSDFGVPVRGLLLHSVGDHIDTGRALAEHADAVGARSVVLGRSARGTIAKLVERHLAEAETDKDSGRREVVLVDPAGSTVE
ncbi:MFS transporter [Spelaeicoccus albus]|uniref:MFS family permease n=1 Tax=Spelaeicoccus albus TaxID=1280376 RepID=A0A7Z0AA08_9MICO|nr:MFS transporter [Spelaeicoccus albus]NYI67159.1 MFS family permease [Spelaeicoccus albus]